MHWPHFLKDYQLLTARKVNGKWEWQRDQEPPSAVMRLLEVAADLHLKSIGFSYAGVDYSVIRRSELFTVGPTK